MHGLRHSATTPRGVIRQSRDNSQRPRSQSSSEVTGGEKRIRELLVPRQRLPTSGRIVPVRYIENELITNRRIGSLQPTEVGFLLAQILKPRTPAP
jgi:hypothetical protein